MTVAVTHWRGHTPNADGGQALDGRPSPPPAPRGRHIIYHLAVFTLIKGNEEWWEAHTLLLEPKWQQREYLSQPGNPPGCAAWDTTRASPLPMKGGDTCVYTHACVSTHVSFCFFHHL